jgi:hypothetical protein
MKPGVQIPLVMLAAALLLGGCGEDTSSTSSVSASLLIPRQLAEELTSITIYVIETDKETYKPDCTLLRGDTEAYKNAKVVKKKTVDFDINGTSALIEGIPDRGRVWRFYARGFNGETLIAHGCVEGVRDVPANDTIEVTIEIERTN